MTCWVGGSWQNLPSWTSVPRVAWSSCSKKYMKILKMFYHGRMASSIKSCWFFTCQWLFEDYPSVIFSGPEFWQGDWDTKWRNSHIAPVNMGRNFDRGRFTDWINLTLQSTVECHQNTWLDFFRICRSAMRYFSEPHMYGSWFSRDHQQHHCGYHQHRSHNHYSRKHY